MTITNGLKFKDSRIWVIRTEPATDEIGARLGSVRSHFEDVTLEIAQILKDALDNSIAPLPNRDICDLDD